MLLVKFEEGRTRNYTIINPCNNARYFVPTSPFFQTNDCVRAFRSLDQACKYMRKVGAEYMFQDLQCGWWFSKGEYSRGEYWEAYTEPIKVEKF